MKRKTKIACTIGPASSEVSDIIKLLDAGMSLARFNFSHGSRKENAKLIKRFFEAKRLRPYKTCALMLDIRGREIRTGVMNNPEGHAFDLGDSCKIRVDDF